MKLGILNDLLSLYNIQEIHEKINKKAGLKAEKGGTFINPQKSFTEGGAERHGTSVSPASHDLHKHVTRLHKASFSVVFSLTLPLHLDRRYSSLLSR